MRRRSKIALSILAVVVSIPAFCYLAWRYQYPYGCSHCCDLIVLSLLEEYAQAHNGDFPAGEATPEASLSLLYRHAKRDDKRLCGDLLRGKTVPEPVVRAILERGELLTPDTCGWHYVEGLNLHDDPNLAILWDKAGLEHDGRRLRDGGHIVLFLNSMREYIHQSEWDAFMAKQHQLLADRATAIHRDAVVRFGMCDALVRIQAVQNNLIGSTWGDGEHRRELIAPIVRGETEGRSPSAISLEEISSAKVVVESAGPRVRFVLRDREIVYEGGHFCRVSK